MDGNQLGNIERLVEPDRVHQLCYSDPGIFEQEINNIFHKTWIYVGHESQVPKPGDYYTTIIGSQPMILVRGKDNRVNVLYNRCPHRGALLCSDRNGNTGTTFKCPYHAWRFNLDGTLLKVPVVEQYEGTNFDPKDPQFHMKPAERVESYRGFVFCSLSKDVTDLKTFLGGAAAAFDDMCDRAPEGEVEIVPTCFRVIQKSNWKIFLENQLDALHPSVTHKSAGRAALEVEKDIEKRTGKKAPLYYHYISAFTEPFYKWDTLHTVGYPNGHCSLEGYMGLRPTDPDTLEYEAVMHKHYGKERTEEILGVNIHHMLIYPCLSVQPPLQQLRAVRPLAADRTLTEIWHFRLKGAPEAIYRRSLAYYQLVNTPSTMINADDLDNFWRCHEGLKTNGGDWVSFHRNAGQDPTQDGVMRSITGMSEMPMRHMFTAWTKYMNGGSAPMSTQPKIQGSATEWAETLDGAPPPRKSPPPLPHVKVSPEVKLEIEEFLYRQAEILDDKRWDEWLNLFTEDGIYWVPVTEDQTPENADGVPNIFYEDLDLMRVRAKRVSHPRAWSQKPPHRTSHTVTNVIVESLDEKTGDVVVRSKFTMAEFRRDVTRYFAGKYRHELKKTKDGYRIRRQRVDLVNSEGPWEYVLQTWV